MIVALSVSCRFVLVSSVRNVWSCKGAKNARIDKPGKLGLRVVK